MRALIALLAGWSGAVACGSNREGQPPPPPPTMETTAPVRSRGLAYEDEVEAIRRLLKDGEVVAAEKAARELMRDHRLDAEGWVVIATAFQVAGDSKEALKAARVATDKAPDNAAAWVAVGAAERMTGGFTRADAALKRALELDPESRAARFNLAGIAADKGEHERARGELAKLVAADPDDFETRYLLATTLLAMGQLGPARKQLDAIVARFPRHFRAQRSLAALAWAEGDYRRAFERATIATRLSDGDRETERLLEGSFYIVAAARLTCEAGAKPWVADKIVSVLERFEEEDGLEGAGTFVELDEKFGDDTVVQERVRKTVGKMGCKPPDPHGP